jgi:hypothetical protein
VRTGLSANAGAAASLQLARLTTLGIVVKLFVVKEQLLAGGEDEILPAIYAPQHFILEFHDPVRCRASCPSNIPPSSKRSTIYVAQAAATALNETKA